MRTVLAAALTLSFLSSSASAAFVATIEATAWGADPTGAVDSTAAIRRAFSKSAYAGNDNSGLPGACVHLAAGTYKISGPIVLPAFNGCIFGDGRANTFLDVSSATFDMSAPGVLVLPNNSGAFASEIHDIAISFTQPETRSRAMIFHFPPAIDGPNAGRARIERVLISGADTCMDMRGNDGGAFIDDVECGALSYGMRWDGALDAVHIQNFHVWNFGLSGGLMSIYGDGHNVCMEVGRIDGLLASNISCFLNNIVDTEDAAKSLGTYQWSNVILDGGVWTHAAGYALVSNLQQTTGSAGSDRGTRLDVSGGYLAIENYFLSTYQSATSIAVSGGTLKIGNGFLGAANPAKALASVTGGVLDIHDSELPIGDFGASLSGGPWVSQSGGGALRFAGNRVTPGVPGGRYTYDLVMFHSHNQQNFFENNQTLGWPITRPPS
jgi:hypothetical protein